MFDATWTGHNRRVKETMAREMAYTQSPLIEQDSYYVAVLQNERNHSNGSCTARRQHDDQGFVQCLSA